jgi:hypothetical protein
MLATNVCQTPGLHHSCRNLSLSPLGLAAGCLSRPDASTIQGSAGTFTCNTPVQVGSTCTFTCAGGAIPVENTAPICRQGGVWEDNTGGVAACGECSSKACKVSWLGIA